MSHPHVLRVHRMQRIECVARKSKGVVNGVTSSHTLNGDLTQSMELKVLPRRHVRTEGSSLVHVGIRAAPLSIHLSRRALLSLLRGFTAKEEV